MKLYKMENKIISLENIQTVELYESTSSHTCKGVKHIDYHFSILIEYMGDNGATRIELPDNNKTLAQKTLDEIFEILSK